MTPEDASKFIAYVLRHAPESIGLHLDAEGWAGIDDLVAGAVAVGRDLTRPDVVRAVDSGAKKRYELSGDGLRIRALQGHSTAQVSRSFDAVAPPVLLFHGTATRFLAAIRAQGLLPGARQHVHLSADEATAVQVGQRHGKAWVLRVDAGRMHALGHAFHRAENGVWLTACVPPEFLSEPERDA
ncbi:RNA 2'-phosphotransferase [Acidovorax cavernicola]|uniref:Probable RNA 2'-phosphotransferase n=1 Tax=Acidovorax cavernicola TaxID=1675792 RepID=A0A9X8CZK0_9BURK|nr:RNA 2'-phosphotransferase [Acidovorax cavernicola]RIX73793.1 RNA 2'-phosphotransferase [Acidovorax cavernicola]